VALAGAISTSTAASAGSFYSGVSNSTISFETVVEFGNNLKPVVVEESSQINIARVIQIGVTGPVDATVIQTGASNYANVMQVGSTTRVAIAQLGASNTAGITQIGSVTDTLLVQVGDMNRGTVSQFGRSNWASIFPFGR